MTNQTMPNTDIIDHDFIEAATTTPGPWVTISMPTVRAGRETLGQSAQFSNLLKLAEERLEKDAHDSGFLDEARALVDNHDFWQQQSDGLIVFAAPGYTRSFRLPLTLADEVSVGESPRLHPVAALLSEAGVFHILQLSQNNVRLFEATRDAIDEVDLGDTPTTAKDVETDNEPQLQHSPQSRGGDNANFHGHADEGNATTERFFREVAVGVDDVLGKAIAHPVVLAAVAEHHSAFAPLTSQRVLDEVVAGNHDHSSHADLLEAARPIAEREAARQHDELLERFGALVGTGKASDQLQSIRRAATEGRVDTLIVSSQPTVADGQADLVEDRVDDIIVEVLRNSGSIAVIDDEFDGKARAIYRY